MKAIAFTKFREQLSELVGRVRFRGERFIVTHWGRPVAQLGPVEKAAPKAPRKRR